VTRAIAAALLLIAAAGCAAGGPPAKPRPRGLDDVDRALGRADAAARLGAHADATRTLEEALAGNGRSPALDRVLLRLGHLYVDPANPAADYRRAARLFDRLLREHPGSRHAAEARAWRELLEAHAVRGQELQRVRQELERRTRDLETLRALDLEVEQHPRRP
jgi:hypothetical protein